MKEVLLTFIYFILAQENLKSWSYVNRLDMFNSHKSKQNYNKGIVRIRGGRRRRRKRKKGEEGEEWERGGGKERRRKRRDTRNSKKWRRK